jgi:iron complex outermembrane receptor protein
MYQDSKRRRSAMTAAICMTIGVAGSLPTLVFAEDSDGDDARLEEVVVTATRRETPIMETPFSMQAFSDETLALNNIVEARDLYDFLPGLTLQENSAQTDHTVQMRGSGISSVGPDDGMSAVGNYVDDIAYMDITSQVAPPLDYFDVERVEVLRGPQGTSFGQDSAGGSIRMYTKKPDLNAFGYKVRAGVADTSSVSTRGWKGNVVLNVPVVEGTFAVRGAYSRSYDPGFGRIAGRPDIKDPNQVEVESYRLKALWTVNENVDITLARAVWNTDIDFFTATNIQKSDEGELIQFPINNRAVLARFPSGIPDNTHNIRWDSLLATVDLGFAELTSSTGYLDAYNRQYNWGLSPGVGILFNVPNRAFTQEIRLVSTQEGAWQWLGGVYYHNARSGTIGIVDIDFSPGFENTYVSATPRFSKAKAAYGELSYQFNDQWVVLGGVRYQTDDRVANNVQQDRDPAVDSPAGSSRGVPVLGTYSGPVHEENSAFTFSQWHPRINVTYYPSDDGMVYLNAATAFRAPIVLRGQQLVDVQRAGLSNLIPKDGTEITSVELGAKWSFMNDQLELQGALATAEWKDVPVGVTLGFDDDGDGTVDRNGSFPIGGASSRIDSIEFVADWHVSNQLTIGYAGARTTGEITEDKSNAPGVTAYPPALKKGGDLPNNSKWSHTLRGTYTTALMDTGWTLFTSAHYSTRSKPGAATTTGLELVPAAASWRSAGLNVRGAKGPWAVDLSVSNLTDFDKRYTGGTSTTVTGMIPRPRQFELQVTYDGFSL